MTSLVLEALPDEILLDIIVYISKTHRPTIIALSLVSCYMRSLVAEYLFKTLTITIWNDKQLLEDMSTIPSYVLNHVRHIKVEGLEQEYTERVDNISNGQEMWAIVRHERFQPDNWTSEAVCNQDLALAKLISNCALLTDLTFKSANQISPCILNTLRTVKPICRLHLHNLYFRTVNSKTPDPHEIAIATSPNLSTISSKCSSHHPDGTADWNLEAIPFLLTGIAPNLAEFQWSTTSVDKSYQADMDALEAPRIPWDGCKFQEELEKKRRSTRSPLKHMKLSAYPLWTAEDFQKLNLSCLVDLHLKVDGASLSELATLGTEIAIPSLRNLMIRYKSKWNPIGGSWEDLTRKEVVSHDLNFALFLQSLRPLKSISLKAHFGRQTLGSILKTHGSRLQHLELRPLLNLDYRTLRNDQGSLILLWDDVNAIKLQCPHISSLVLPVPSQWLRGNKVSRAICETIGSIPGLTDAMLSVMPVGRRSNVSIFDDTPVPSIQEIGVERNGNTQQRQNALIRSRFAEGEVLDIFSMVASGKQTCENPMPLRKLRLKIWGNYFSHEILYGFSRPFESQNWCVERGLRDDECGKVLAKLKFENFRPW